MDAPRRQRLAELDGLRGVAATLVLLFHLTYHQDDLRALAPFHVPFGHYGVELFFIISGLVIFMTLERAPTTRQFVISRFARLFPAYWCAVLLTALIACWLDPDRPSLVQVAVNLTMLQRFVGVPHIDGPYWTLVVELQFYAVMAVLCAAGRLRAIEPCALVYLLCTHFYRAVIALGWLPDMPPQIHILHYGSFFVIGICLWRLREGHARRTTFAVLALAVMYPLWGAGPASMLAGGVVYFCVTVGLAALVWLAITGHARLLACRPLVLLGAISYPLYLVHQRIGTLLMTMLHTAGVPGRLAFAGAVVAVLGLATAIHLCVEQPGRRRILSMAMTNRPSRAAPPPLFSSPPCSAPDRRRSAPPRPPGSAPCRPSSSCAPPPPTPPWSGRAGSAPFPANGRSRSWR